MNKETLSTSENNLPKHKNALEEKYQTLKEKEPLNPDNIKEQKSTSYPTTNPTPLTQP